MPPTPWLLAAAATATAGAIHLAAGPAHVSSPAWYWSGFVVVGVAQLLAAVILLTRGRPMPAVAINLAAIVVWTASNTVGLPGGVGGHDIGRADSITIGLQAAGLLAVVLPRLLPIGRLGALTLTPAVVAMFALGAVSVVDLQVHRHAHDAHTHDTRTHDIRTHDTRAHDTRTDEQTHVGETHDDLALNDPGGPRQAGLNSDGDHPNDGDDPGRAHGGDGDHDHGGNAHDH
jgi:hypothetical protein